MAGPRGDGFGLFLRRAELLVLCWQWPCPSQMPQLGSWVSLSSVTPAGSELLGTESSASNPHVQYAMV